MILNQLGIYGWKEADENLVVASLLTGDAPRAERATPHRQPRVRVVPLGVIYAKNAAHSSMLPATSRRRSEERQGPSPLVVLFNLTLGRDRAPSGG